MSQFWSFSTLSQDTVDLSITGRIGIDMTRRETSGRAGAEIDRFITDIDAHAGAKFMNVLINSSGGNADIGLAVYSKLRWHPALKTVTIEGGACSAASLIVMAGDRRLIAEDAYLLVHEVHQAVFGNAAMLRTMADSAEKMTEVMIGFFSNRSGLPEDVIRKMFREDTIITAERALELGLVHEIIPARHVPLNAVHINRVLPNMRFVNDCLTCKSPCERCLSGEL